ncbi:TPA: DUF2335 domain-containing protein [Serratia marcescens]|uniref:DUF2335 domain-containing protein n=1 Tax=Serratia marcescens TaxID=615 RepID=UPI003FA7361D
MSGRVQSGKTELLVNEVINNPEVIQRLANRPEGMGLMMQMQVSTHRSGPLPDAEELARYEKIAPGMAQEILEMAKSAQGYRQKQGERSLSGAIWKDRLGQIFAIICVFVFAYVALEMIKAGAFGYAALVLGAELVALVGVFVIGRTEKKEEPTTPAKKKKR